MMVMFRTRDDGNVQKEIGQQMILHFQDNNNNICFYSISGQ